MTPLLCLEDFAGPGWTAKLGAWALSDITVVSRDMGSEGLSGLCRSPGLTTPDSKPYYSTLLVSLGPHPIFRMVCGGKGVREEALPSPLRTGAGR